MCAAVLGPCFIVFTIPGLLFIADSKITKNYCYLTFSLKMCACYSGLATKDDLRVLPSSILHLTAEL